MKSLAVTLISSLIISCSGLTGLAQTMVVVKAGDIAPAEELVYNTGYKKPTFIEIQEPELSDEQAAEAYSENLGEGIDSSYYSSYTSAEYYYWTNMSTTYYYDQLSDLEKTAWNDLNRLCVEVIMGTEMVEKITIESNYKGMSSYDAQQLALKFKLSHPQYYFLSDLYGSSYSSTGAKPVLYVYDEFQNGSTRQASTAQFKSKIDSWIAQVSKGEDLVDKEKIAMDIVVNNTIYEPGYYDQSAYSMVCEGETVCAGYAAVMQILLNSAGVQTVEVTSETHAWNLVNLYGYWYQVDATWADQNDNYYDLIDYAYFNKSVATYGELSNPSDHVIESDWEGYLPELVYDSTDISGKYDYSYHNPYFTVDQQKYFMVNSNLKRGEYKATGLDVDNAEKLPATVSYDSKKYTVIGAGIAVDPVIKSGVYIEDGNIVYYDNNVISNKTGMGIDKVTGKKYWFDNGVAARSKEVYDPESDAWYWFDEDGSMATSKDAYVWNADHTAGKWVRYKEDGSMVKGEDYMNGGWYWFDPITGEMLKGYQKITNPYGSEQYSYYDNTTGQMRFGEFEVDGIAYGFGMALGDGYTGWDILWNESVGEYTWFWYEDGIRQGYNGNDSSYRGKEIYDPDSNAWYWLDNIQRGAMAKDKDVYQESYAGIYADRPDGTGKWVRYDVAGDMIKGWSFKNDNTYYFDMETGAMVKGSVVIDGKEYEFDINTGIMIEEY